MVKAQLGTLAQRKGTHKQEMDKRVNRQKEQRLSFLGLLLSEINGVYLDSSYWDNPKLTKYIISMRESCLSDLYNAIKDMGILEMLVYFKAHLNHPEINRTTLKKINISDFYFYWYTRLVEVLNDFNPVGKTKDDFDGHAGWIMKQLSRGRMDSPTKIACINTLRKMWLYGGFSKEHKEYVRLTLDEHGMKTKGYGTLKIK